MHKYKFKSSISHLARILILNSDFEVGIWYLGEEVYFVNTLGIRHYITCKHHKQKYFRETPTPSCYGYSKGNNKPQYSARHINIKIYFRFTSSVKLVDEHVNRMLISITLATSSKAAIGLTIAHSCLETHARSELAT